MDKLKSLVLHRQISVQLLAIAELLELLFRVDGHTCRRRLVQLHRDELVLLHGVRDALVVLRAFCDKSNFVDLLLLPC